jgi:hypothetical protein
MFKHDPCSCPPDLCLKEVDPPEDCVNRLTGIVEAVKCEKCNGETVHHNGECIRCQRLLADSQKESITLTSSPIPLEQSVKDSISKTIGTSPSTLSLSITLGGEPVLVTNKKQVAKILKILLED